jgi:hypothetical protein
VVRYGSRLVLIWIHGQSPIFAFLLSFRSSFFSSPTQSKEITPVTLMDYPIYTIGFSPVSVFSSLLSLSLALSHSLTLSVACILFASSPNQFLLPSVLSLCSLSEVVLTTPTKMWKLNTQTGVRFSSFFPPLQFLCFNIHFPFSLLLLLLLLVLPSFPQHWRYEWSTQGIIENTSFGLTFFNDGTTSLPFIVALSLEYSLPFSFSFPSRNLAWFG